MDWVERGEAVYEESAQAARRRAMKAKVFTRQGCHLCEVAEAVLVEHGFEVELVDVDADPALRARYDQCVPVVEIDGRERFRGRIDRRLLRRLMAGRTADR
jgi:glutaredoxin